jgi:Tol biopolymer transport system component
LADWGIDLDSHVISVDPQARRTTEPSVLVDGAHEDFTAIWSPDGQWIAYHTHRPSTATTPFYDAPGVNDAIYVRRAEEVDAPELPMSENGWEIFQPRWSPDGRTILYSSWDRNGTPGLYSLFAVAFAPETGTKLEVRKLPMPEGLISPCWAAWSPDGREIAIEDANGLDTRALWIIAAKGGRGRRLYDYRAETFGGVDWAPDGKTLVFSALDEGRMAIFTLDITTSHVQKLSNEAGNLLHPRVSPDGQWIACSRIRTTQELWRARLAAMS